MICTKVSADRYRLQRTKEEAWPTSTDGWRGACGFPGDNGQPPTNLKFDDGAFIAEYCEVNFGIPDPSRAMLDKWAARLPDRMTITDFWEWLEKQSTFINQSNLEIEKLLDTYHGINRKQLEDERRAVLEKHRQLNPT